MKLDTLFEKFLSLFKKEESEIEETEMKLNKKIVSLVIYDVQEQGERKLARLVLFENSGADII